MEAESFKKQFLPYHAKLYRIAFALIENKADAEDIVQEVYYKLWTKRDELASIQKPEAFCVTLVRNLCLDYLRSPKYNPKEALSENIQVEKELLPDRQLEEQDKLSQICKLIEQLPENQRQVITLRGLNDCSLEEIEDITGLSAANVRVLLSRARKMIREQLNKVQL
ncbi:MAG: sigma-70 family RNA polymerase sigma factor [Tannerellaceae bacterium]|nr:sigma-70 family RNA polymerase sigma factor [Tannerellaceae bacterium]MCD8265368.1 sigma-70 family RNA polymerase sigma factor [Tannerellaceae bacterium]